MSTNPPQKSLQNLYNIAIYQKAIMWCILAYLLAVIGRFALPREAEVFLLIVFIGVILTATVFVFLLALSVYGVAKGVVFGIMTLLPFVGLISLLIVNQTATEVLRENGYRVGLMGANLSQFKRNK